MIQKLKNGEKTIAFQYEKEYSKLNNQMTPMFGGEQHEQNFEKKSYPHGYGLFCRRHYGAFSDSCG